MAQKLITTTLTVAEMDELLYEGNLLIGVFEVIFSAYTAFRNGGGVYNYTLKEINRLNRKIIVYGKDFIDKDDNTSEELKRNTTYVIYGNIQNETYKDSNGQWINKGGYINIKMYKEV